MYILALSGAFFSYTLPYPFQFRDYDRSTNLDSWQLSQLRTMKVGGNQSGKDFFIKNGGSALLSDSDTKKKYSSRIADMYKEELAKRVKEDATMYVCTLLPPCVVTCRAACRYPTRIFVEGAELEATPPANKADEDDFFSSWDKPTSKPSTPAPSEAPTSLPILGRSLSATSNNSSPKPPSAPRTISSSSLRSTSAMPVGAGGRPGSKLAASRLGSSSSVTGSSSGGAVAGAKKGKLGGLGAKKAAAPINFDEVEKKAREEAAQTKKMEEEQRRRQEEEKARLETVKLEATAVSAKPKSPEAGSTSSKPAAAAVEGAATKSMTPQGNTQDLERLGMGFRKLGFGSVPPSGTAPTSQSKYALYHHS